MSKKNVYSEIQEVNPEQYIREKSRGLPIYKCWINEDWEDLRLANILITRRQTDNNNLSFCLYLVDLDQLGVKDTLYAANIPENDFIRTTWNYPHNNLTDISYELAHNIIYSAVEYAENSGFKPHTVFTETTSFFLEQDDGNVPLISVKCGDEEEEEAPVYVRAEIEAEKHGKQIIAQFEKNFNYILGQELDDYGADLDWLFNFEEDDDKYKDDFECTEEIARLNEEQQIELFFDLVNKKKSDVPFKESKKLNLLSVSLALKFIDHEGLEPETEILHKDLGFPMVPIRKFPASLFSGIQNKNSQTIITLFEKTFSVIADPAKGEKALRKFKASVPLKAISCFLELAYLEVKDLKSYQKRLEKYYLQYPEYFLIKLYWHKELCLSRINYRGENAAFDNLRKLLSENPRPVSDIEYAIFFYHYVFFYINQHRIEDRVQTITRLVAIREYLDNVEYPYYNMSDKIYELLYNNQIEVLVSLLSKKKTK
jgi:hypothetical protein